MAEKVEKPPLGVMPRRIWQEKRSEDLVAAMVRYTEAGKLIDADWLRELSDLYHDLGWAPKYGGIKIHDPETLKAAFARIESLEQRFTKLEIEVAFKEEPPVEVCETCRHWHKYADNELGNCTEHHLNKSPGTTCAHWRGQPREPVQLPGDKHPSI